MTGDGPGPANTVKCVVWDIDNTLLTGTYLESGGAPPGADPAMTAVLAELGGRGILHALASKNPPEAAEHTARVTGWRFAATECGWGSKSGALARIADTLGIAVDALAFVDDDPYERAEVAAALPGVLVLAPEEAADAGGWPEFSPPVITAEARRRGEMYAERQRRQAAGRSFGGTREEFLESAGTQVRIAAATAADVPRLAELSARTRQFNSAGAGMTQDWFRRMLAAGDRDVVTVRLRDAFGDDGVVGGCVIARQARDAAGAVDGAGGGDGGEEAAWMVPLLMMSCRAMGRGVIDAVLAWLARQAARSGASGLRIPCPANSRNVPLRLALAAAGFRAPEAGAAYQWDPGTPPPGLPHWVSAPGEPGGSAA
jgi:methoxymalonate biosynthesis protein